MKFIKPKDPRVGTETVARWFLFFPLTIGDETRWLEFANVRLRWYENRAVGGGWGGGPGWYIEAWAD